MSGFVNLKMWLSFFRDYKQFIRRDEEDRMSWKVSKGDNFSIISFLLPCLG